jgi:hypothetical protein
MTPRRTAFLALAALLLGAGWLLASERPPANLHLEGDHWTAWIPPTSFPEDAEIYTIERGDTLWDLSGQFYGDPYLWPQLWERNQYIQDAHWIYPGDPLVVGVEVTDIDDIAQADSTGEDSMAGSSGTGDDQGLNLDRSSSAPVALGSEDDIYCSGFIGAEDTPYDSKVIGSEHAISAGNVPGSDLWYGGSVSVILNLSLGDVIYLDGGRNSGQMPGSVYTIMRAQGKVDHPASHETVGYFYRYLGRARILSVQENSAIAEIVHACNPIGVGDLLRPFTPQPVPLARRSGLRGVNDPVEAAELADAPYIVHSDDRLISLGEGHVVYIDRGAADVAPGDMFTIYRETPQGLPPLIVGELAILSVTEQASMAKILESRYTVFVGDRLEPKSY